MGLVKTSAVLVALFAVGVQWLDQSDPKRRLKRADSAANPLLHAVPPYVTRPPARAGQVHSVPASHDRFSAGNKACASSPRYGFLRSGASTRCPPCGGAGARSPPSPDGVAAAAEGFRLKAVRHGPARRSCRRGARVPGRAAFRVAGNSRALCYASHFRAAASDPAPRRFRKAVADGVGDPHAPQRRDGAVSWSAPRRAAPVSARRAPVLALGALATLAVSNPALEFEKSTPPLSTPASRRAARARVILAAQPGHLRAPRRASLVPTSHSPREETLDGPGARAGRRGPVVPRARCARWATREIHAPAPAYLVAWARLRRVARSLTRRQRAASYGQYACRSGCPLHGRTLAMDAFSFRIYEQHSGR